MPEGDSIHRIAARLADVVGQPIVHATTQGLVRASLAGRTIATVAAHGKHLVIALDDGTEIRAHLGMYGRFFRDPARPSSPGRESLVLALPATRLVWLGAKTIEIAARRAPRHGMAVAALGPDVLAADFDPAAAAARAAQHGATTIGEVLLDQRIAAGIGNVYKSEVLFVCGVDPRTPTCALATAMVVAIYAEAVRLMKRNLGPGPRRTIADRDDPDPYFVYSRTDKPCRRCASNIACFSLGDPPRWTWACPRCQPFS